MAKPTIGIIGAGHIGSQVARLAISCGYPVVISNSRGPETLAELVGELGPSARAATAVDAAKAGEIVVVSIPLKNYRDVPVAPLAGKIVIDTNNYYPQRDGHIRRTRQRVNDDRRALAGASPDLEGGQGVQPYLGCGTDHRTGNRRDRRTAVGSSSPATMRPRKRP